MIGDLHDIFDPAAPEAGVVEPGFDSNDRAFEQGVVDGAAHAREFVHGETEAVTRAVEKADGARGGAFRLVAAGGKDIDAAAVDVATVGAGADLLECGELGGPDGGDQCALGFAGTAAEKCAGHIAVIAGSGDARENIDDDQFVRANRAGAAFVRIARLVSAGDDGIGGNPAGLKDGDLDGELKQLACDKAAAMEELTPGNFARAEDFFGSGKAERTQAVALADSFGLRRGFDFPFRKERAGGDFEIETEFEEFVENSRGEIVRDGEAGLFELFRDEENHLGGTDCALGPEFASALHIGLKGENTIEVGGLFNPAKLQGTDDGVFLAAEAKGHERVGDIDAAEIERVGAAFGVGVEERRRRIFRGQGKKEL